MKYPIFNAKSLFVSAKKVATDYAEKHNLLKMPGKAYPGARNSLLDWIDESFMDTVHSVDEVFLSGIVDLFPSEHNSLNDTLCEVVTMMEEACGTHKISTVGYGHPTDLSYGSDVTVCMSVSPKSGTNGFTTPTVIEASTAIFLYAAALSRTIFRAEGRGQKGLYIDRAGTTIAEMLAFKFGTQNADYFYLAGRAIALYAAADVLTFEKLLAAIYAVAYTAWKSSNNEFEMEDEMTLTHEVEEME